MSYPEHMLGESYPFVEMRLVYSTAPDGWVAFLFLYIVKGFSNANNPIYILSFV